MNSIILLFGGTSDERLVSVASAQNIAPRLKDADLWFINESGAVTQTELTELKAHERPFEVPFRPVAAPFARTIEESLKQVKSRSIFIGLHGTEGEDGSLQFLFEKSKVSYTGSNSVASRICFDKALAKAEVAQVGIQVPEGFSFHRSDLDLEPKLNALMKSAGRVVAKPLASGSSFGLRFLSSLHDCKAFLKELPSSSYQEYLIEPFLSGREMTVGIIERADGSLCKLPPSEVIMQAGRNFDYDGKYLGLGSTEVTPAKISPEQTLACQMLALEAHQALGCSGYSRTDMILTEKGPIFLETNTLPGLSKASFVPQQLAAAGIALETFLAEQAGLALHRPPARGL